MHTSQLGGIFDGIMNLILGIFSYIPKMMYLLWVSAASILDLLQSLFRQLVGLDTIYVETTGQTVETSGDLVMIFVKGIFGIDGQVKYSPLATAFWGLIIVAVMLLIISTIIAIIRSEYTPEKDGNGKSKYIGRALKAFASFAIIPITCFFGIELSNIALRAIDYATVGTGEGDELINYDVLESQESNGKRTYTNYDIFGLAKPSGYTTFSGTAFKVAAFNANRLRKGDYTVGGKGWSTFNLFIAGPGESAEDVAQKMDNAFANNYKLKNPTHLTLGKDNAWFIISGIQDPWWISYLTPVTNFSKFNVGWVWYYYDLWRFDFLSAFAAIMVMCTLFTNIIFGMMKRTIELVGLFIISPPIIAIMPLDGGGAFDRWKKSFLAKTLAAYGAVVAMNIFNLILPYINTLRFFPPMQYNPVIYLINNIISCLFIIAGLMSVKSFVAIASSIVGGDDINKEGEGIAKEVGSAVAKVGQVALTVGMAVASGGASLASGVGMAKMGMGAAKGAKAGKAAAGAAGGGGGPGGLAGPTAGGIPGAGGGGGVATEAETPDYASNVEAYKTMPGYDTGTASTAKGLGTRAYNKYVKDNIDKGPVDIRRAQAAREEAESRYLRSHMRQNSVPSESASPSANRDAAVEATPAEAPIPDSTPVSASSYTGPTTWAGGIASTVKNRFNGLYVGLSKSAKAISGLFGGPFIEAFKEGGGFGAYKNILQGKDPATEKAIAEIKKDLINKAIAEEKFKNDVDKAKKEAADARKAKEGK